MNRLPETTVYVTINKQSFKEKIVVGEAKAGSFSWNFIWDFSSGNLIIKPPLVRALVQDALLRFLLKEDYLLEAGNNYDFKISAKL